MAVSILCENCINYSKSFASILSKATCDTNWCLGDDWVWAGTPKVLRTDTARRPISAHWVAPSNLGGPSPLRPQKRPRYAVFLFWCPGGDSNPHTSRYQILNLACLPIPPPRPAEIEADKKIRNHCDGNLFFRGDRLFS